MLDPVFDASLARVHGFKNGNFVGHVTGEWKADLLRFCRDGEV